MTLVFDWDEDKARRNRAKHKISFDEAKTIFGDPSLVTFPDEFHSHQEERFISIGTSSKSRVILIVHTEFEEADDVVIRFINARKATPAERQIYEQAKD
jgi:uncharacterized DUF497 family protein